MDQGPKYQGSLEKQGKVARQWKKYWFILKGNGLTYVKSQDKSSKQGSIDMAQAQSVRSCNGKSTGQFEIVTRSRTHVLNAESGELRDKWVTVLHEAMAWYSRHSSSSSSTARLSGTSHTTRASCNSIESDYGYARVSLSSSPSLSSGYGTSENNRASDLRNSDNSDIMYNNPGYDKSQKEKNGGTLKRETDSSPIYDDIREAETPRQSQHMGLRRLCPMPSRQSKVDSRTDSMLSDTSGLYDSVHEPAHLAISHIVKGYANIPQNKGPQPEDDDDDDDEGDYDDVFVQSSSATSSVVMRNSAISRSSNVYSTVKDDERTSKTDPPYATVDVALKKSKKAATKPTTPTKPITPTKPKHLSTSRASRLPSDVNQMFDFEQLSELPNPRMELTHRTSFDDIRSFLANNRTNEEYYDKCEEQSGKGIQALKDFLAQLGDQL